VGKAPDAASALARAGNRTRRSEDGESQQERPLADLSRPSRRRRRMSQNELVRRAMNNDWLAQQGLPSMEQQWVSIRDPGGPKGSTANR
jgi:hypothetical protein